MTTSVVFSSSKDPNAGRSGEQVAEEKASSDSQSWIQINQTGMQNLQEQTEVKWKKKQRWNTNSKLIRNQSNTGREQMQEEGAKTDLQVT